MKIDGEKISSYLQKLLKQEINKLKKKAHLKLVVFLVGQIKSQASSVKAKAKLAKKLKIQLKVNHDKDIPNFIDFAHRLKNESLDASTAGIIIEQPLPTQLSTDSIFDYIGNNKEIEGHKKKSTFLSPAGLAVLTILKFAYGGKRIDKNLFVNIDKDKNFFKKMFKNKKVVLISYDFSIERPIGKALSEAKINYININDTTVNPESYYQNADVIIEPFSEKSVINKPLKEGSILIKDETIQSIKLTYIYKNLVEAMKLQN